MPRWITGGEAELVINLSYNIRYAIRDKNTTGAAVARKAGIKPSVLYSYTNARPVLDYAVVQKIAEALDCTVYDLTKKYDHSMPDNDI
jgi:transcriptional regulator with XRE-family HTH domain